MGKSAEQLGLEEYKGYWTRPGTLDQYIVDELSGYQVMPLAKDDVVLDIGGCIGTYAQYAHSKGVKKVVTVEPMPDNYAVLKKNVDRRVLALNAAAVSQPGLSKISFYVNTGQNKGAHSIIPTRGREVIQVQAVYLGSLLDLHQPTKVKMDCEGAEYELLAEPLPKCVKGLVMEMHLTKNGHRELAGELHKSLLRQKFKAAKSPILNTKAWNTFAYYER